jgi:hypothetical protein
LGVKLKDRNGAEKGSNTKNEKITKVIVAKFFHFLSSIACARASANPFLLQFF